MKVNKIISLTLFNASSLLFLSAVLASCQNKTNLRKSGHYSSLRQARSIASIETEKESYDPRQVYLYCSLRTVSTESCYNEKFKKLSIKNTKSFTAVAFEVEEVTKSILDIVSSDINKNIERRKNFCLKNSKHYFKKCLTQYVERDSIVTLNKYQKSNSDINGYEYIHLKRSIASVYNTKLVQIEKNNKASLKKK
jgi:hypothetical protein